MAALAGISTDYYRRLEQGQEDSPSVQVLDAIGRALQLDDDAVTYMRNLLHHRAIAGRMKSFEQPHSAIGVLLDSWSVTAAVVVDPGMTVVRANNLAKALCPHFGAGANTVRAIFLEPQMRSFYRDWERLTSWCVSFTRAMLGQRPDPTLISLVDELRTHSAWFRHLWARHDVTQETPAVMLINHPQP